VKRKYFVLIALLGLVSLVSLTVGPVFLPPQKVLLSVFSKQESLARRIVLDLRFPRLMLSILVGANLGMVGASLQGILLNPLADPYILGVASGASFGAALALALGLGNVVMIPLFSFAGALVAIFAVYSLASVRGRIPKDTLLLAGVLVGFFFSALVMLTMVLGGKELHSIVYMLMGHLGVVFHRRLIIPFAIFGVVSGIVFAAGRFYGRELNILSLGEERAAELGVESEKLKKTIFFLSSLSIGVTVAFCGQIGFVGLVIPHIARLLFGPDHRVLIPCSFLLGATLLVVADMIARSIAPFEIPVGVITALFGVPFFAYLLRKRMSE
jgi:iron complex transport system permease protein